MSATTRNHNHPGGKTRARHAAATNTNRSHTAAERRRAIGNTVSGKRPEISRPEGTDHDEQHHRRRRTHGDTVNATKAKPGRTPRLAVALPEDTRAWVDQVAACADDPPAATAATLLRAMRHAHTAELRRIPLTVPEADVLAAILGNDLQLGSAVGSRTFHQVSDALDLAHQLGPDTLTYANQFGVDEDALLTKLRRLGPSADLALRIAIALSWDYRPEADVRNAIKNTIEAYRNAGLTIIDTPEVPAP